MSDPEFNFDLDFSLSEDEKARLKELDEIAQGFVELDKEASLRRALINVRGWVNSSLSVNGANENSLLHENDAPTLSVPNPGTVIGLATNARRRHIGHFSPITAEPVIWSDFAGDSDIVSLEAHAKEQHQASFKTFIEGPPGSTWVSYLHPDVQALHDYHQHVLINQGLLREITYHYNNDVPGLSKSSRFDFDNEESTAAVSLRTVLNSQGGIQDQLLSLRIMKCYTYNDSGKSGEVDGVAFIDLARLETIDGIGNHYVPIKIGECDVVEPPILDQLVSLSMEVRRLAVKIRNFDTELLGVVLEPATFNGPN
jgi:hypothetical protein